MKPEGLLFQQKRGIGGSADVVLKFSKLRFVLFKFWNISFKAGLLYTSPGDHEFQVVLKVKPEATRYFLIHMKKGKRKAV